MPSGALLFACLALPGYRDCGVYHPMTQEPLVIAACCVGVVVALAACSVGGVRRERAIAIACGVLALASAGLLGFLCLAVNTVYAGATLALDAAGSLVLGCLIWEREARGKPDTASYLLRIIVPLVIVALALTALLSPWKPAEDRPVDVPYLGPT